MSAPTEKIISASLLHFNINYIKHVATYHCMKKITCIIFTVALKHSHWHEVPKCVKNTSSMLHLLRLRGLASRDLNVRTGQSIYFILSRSPIVTEFPKQRILSVLDIWLWSQKKRAGKYYMIRKGKYYSSIVIFGLFWHLIHKDLIYGFCSRAAGQLSHLTLPPAGLVEWLQAKMLRTADDLLQLQATARGGGKQRGQISWEKRHVSSSGTILYGSVHTWAKYLWMWFTSVA